MKEENIRSVTWGLQYVIKNITDMFTNAITNTIFGI